jgi:hypothetical protein
MSYNRPWLILDGNSDRRIQVKLLLQIFVFRIGNVAFSQRYYEFLKKHIWRPLNDNFFGKGMHTCFVSASSFLIRSTYTILCEGLLCPRISALNLLNFSASPSANSFRSMRASTSSTSAVYASRYLSASANSAASLEKDLVKVTIARRSKQPTDLALRVVLLLTLPFVAT